MGEEETDSEESCREDGNGDADDVATNDATKREEALICRFAASSPVFGAVVSGWRQRGNECAGLGLSTGAICRQAVEAEEGKQSGDSESSASPEVHVTE